MYKCTSFFSFQPISSLSTTSATDSCRAQSEPVDSLTPQDIVEEEEVERVAGLMQRDNLVRGLGIVEHVYRLLHCTPGTVGMQVKNGHKYNVSHIEQIITANNSVCA